MCVLEKITVHGLKSATNDANVNMVVNFAITMAKKFEILVLAILRKVKKCFLKDH